MEKVEIQAVEQFLTKAGFAKTTSRKAAPDSMLPSEIAELEQELNSLDLSDFNDL